MASTDSGQSFMDDAERQADYSDFLRRYQQDPTSISAEEAARRYSELLSHAPPTLAAEANQMAFAQLPGEDRQVLANQFLAAHQDPNRPFDSYSNDPSQAAAPGELGRMTLQAGKQDPGLLSGLLGPDSPLNSPIGRMVITTAVAYLTSRMVGNQRQQGGATASGGGLADLISVFLGGGGQAQAGGLPGGQAQAGELPGGLGGLLGALAQGSGQAPSGSGLPGGLGGLLGALSQAGDQSQAGGQPQAGGLPGGLGDLLGALTGGGAQSSGGGLGDLLGALAGGEPNASQPPASTNQPPAGSDRPGVLLQGIKQQSEASDESADSERAPGEGGSHQSHLKE